jgi:hypothetical protein
MPAATAAVTSIAVVLLLFTAARMLLTSYAVVAEVVLDTSELRLELLVLIALVLFHEKAPLSTCQILHPSPQSR